MSTTKLQHIQNLRQIFQKAVASVRPVNLLSATNNFMLRPQVAEADNNSNKLEINIQGNKLDLTNKRCHVVGFGKAVLGMAVQLEDALCTHLVSGVLSIPSGTRKQFQHVAEMQLSANTCIEVIEGAANNQPDEQALHAAQRIKKLARQMTSDDVLFVLISGGGSALLPLPRSPVTLTEKMCLVRELANRGAAIDELNIVRIALSHIKGGRLAAAARNAHAVISFIISDIVGDPIDLIASGPTCGNTKKRQNAQNILQKYDLWQTLPAHVRTVVNAPTTVEETQPGSNNAIYIVGDNRVATMAAVQEALKFGYNPFIATSTLQGEVQHLWETHINFLQCIVQYQNKQITEEQLKAGYMLDTRTWTHFLKTLLMCEKSKKPLLLIYAGEPTVQVVGSGVGGRNQELALRMSLALFKNADFHNVSFLSAGTDGIDGPTPAAGAIGSDLVIKEFLDDTQRTVTDVDTYINNNDSYSFYKNLKHAELFHIVIGHTGTNVMDLQFILLG